MLVRIVPSMRCAVGALSLAARRSNPALMSGGSTFSARM
jgi:hypothetical protein